MDHMEYSITLPSHVELTNAGAEWAAMKQRHFNHVNPNPTLSHQPSPANLFTSFLISISFDQVQDVLNVLGLSVEEALRFNKILQNFEDLCLPRFLIIYNRYRFFMCKQNGPEFNGFLQQLLAWSDLCEFGEMKDILLKDSIIRGISEESVRQHLLRTEQLDFNKTVEICKAGLVKQYATDRAKTSDNELADAWTDTCNDMVENNNSVFKFQTVDKSTGNSVEVVEKETQTDLEWNDLSALVNCNEVEVGTDAEKKQNENSDYSPTHCLGGSTSLFVHNAPSHGSLKDETKANCDPVTNSIVSVPDKKNHEDKEPKRGKDAIFDDLKGGRKKKRKFVGNDFSNNDGKKDDFNEFGCVDKELSKSHDDEKDVYKSTTLCPQDDDKASPQHIAQNKTLVCNVCSSAFKTQTDLEAHMSIHAENQFVCDKCGDRFEDSYSLKKHMHNHTSKEPYKCQDCQKSFKWAASLQRHKKSHSAARPYKCKNESCDSSFNDLTSLRRHANSHTKSRPFKCPSCESTFPDSWALRVHERIHSGERPYHCAVCDATFTRAHHLKDHEKLHTGEKPYECDFCQAKFIEASKLKSHRRKHTGEKPYLCKLCGKTFTWSAAYKRHMKTHTLEKPYTCHVCGNAFADHTTLIRHQRTHTGEKPYRCDHCLASFADSSTLSRHRQIHSTGKDFTCNVCNASFAVKAYLTRHLRIHSGEKPHQCNICSARFGDTSKLARHKKIHSRIKSQNKEPRLKQKKPKVKLRCELQGRDDQQKQLCLDQQQCQKQQTHNNQLQEQLHQHQHLHQQQKQQQLVPAENDAEKTSFLLWQEDPQEAVGSTLSATAILSVTVSHTPEEPLLLSLNTSSGFPTANQPQHVQDVHDMNQYLSSPLLEFDNHLHHDNESHDLQPPDLHDHHDLHPSDLHNPHDLQHPGLHDPHDLQPPELHVPHDLHPSQLHNSHDLHSSDLHDSHDLHPPELNEPHDLHPHGLHLPELHNSHDLHPPELHEPHDLHLHPLELHEPRDFNLHSSELHEPRDLHPPELHSLHFPTRHHPPMEDNLSTVTDQSFITDIPVHMVASTVLDDILNLKS